MGAMHMTVALADWGGIFTLGERLRVKLLPLRSEVHAAVSAGVRTITHLPESSRPDPRFSWLPSL